MKYMTEYQTLKVADIIPAPYNPREDILPGSAEYNALKRSLEEHGLVEPLVVNLHNMHCIGGNQRLTVIRDLGWESVICSVIDQPDELQEKKLCLALNKIDGRWDNDLLGKLLADDDVTEYETGFSEAEAMLYKQLENTEEPDVADEDELLEQFGEEAVDSDDYGAGENEASPIDDFDYEERNTLVKIGNFHFKLDISEYHKILDKIRDRGIFDEQSISSEIKRRLLSND